MQQQHDAGADPTEFTFFVKYNSSGTNHTVTFENGPSFNQALNDGSNVSRMFQNPGTYNYYCTIHGKSMHGTIVVT